MYDRADDRRNIDGNAQSVFGGCIVTTDLRPELTAWCTELSAEQRRVRLVNYNPNITLIVSNRLRQDQHKLPFRFPFLESAKLSYTRLGSSNSTKKEKHYSSGVEHWAHNPGAPWIETN